MIRFEPVLEEARAKEALVSGLRDLLLAPPSAIELLGGGFGPESEASDAFPVARYATVVDLLEDRAAALSIARLVTNPAGTMHLAEVRPDAEGRHRFLRITNGPGVDRMLTSLGRLTGSSSAIEGTRVTLLGSWTEGFFAWQLRREGQRLFWPTDPEAFALPAGQPLSGSELRAGLLLT
jgi:hypothetical protein